MLRVEGRGSKHKAQGTQQRNGVMLLVVSTERTTHAHVHGEERSAPTADSCGYNEGAGPHEEGKGEEGAIHAHGVVCESRSLAWW